ncbi:nuclease-related domain-containing protein [Rhizohabitans arisaemae]|uniref:nuclease-related domain-containing protein n=1 Tax=Rhizohabitans arisaemae TaxID=2720610 RepID=UPI0024B1DDB3|nr:nuclease-related domain-containing protein [Rhizohabitans arisaemae]
MDSANTPEDANAQSPIWVSERPPRAGTPDVEETTTYAPVERASLKGFLQQPEYAHWRRRLIVSLGAAVLFTILLNWRVGLTAAVIAAIADTVYRARTVSSVSAWRRASVAERRTEAQLRRLERNGYYSLHARALPDSDAQIDHLVVGPTGIYAVDSEKWDKRLPVRAMSHRKLFHGPFNQKARLDEANWEASTAAKLISDELGREITVVPSLAIYGPSIPWKVLNIREVDVFDGSRVRSWITKREKCLTPADVQEIAEAAEAVLPTRYPPS